MSTRLSPIGIPMAGGALAPGGGSGSGGTSGADKNWESDDVTWGGVELVHGEARPILVSGTRFFRADTTNLFDTEPVQVIVERTGLTVFGRDREGQPKSDPMLIKLIREIWPVFIGIVGTKVDIYAGGQVGPNSPITWQGPFPFVIGQSVSVQPLISTTHFAIRFESLNQLPWTLVNYTLDIEVLGTVPR